MTAAPFLPDGADDVQDSDPRPDGERTGKAEAASGPLFLREGGAGTAPVLAYHIAPPEAVPRPDPALAAAIAHLAAHALDLGQRSLTLLDRMAAPQTPALLAAALGAARIARRAPGGQAIRLQGLAEVLSALARTGPSDAPADDGTLLVWEPGLAPCPASEREAARDGLEQRGLVLAIPLDGETAGSVGPLLDLHPDLHLLPWTGTFLQAFARHRGLGANDLWREVGAELALAATIDGPEAAERELALHLHLRQVMADGAIADHGAAVRAIRIAISEARHGMAGVGREARQKVARILGSAREPDQGGPIGAVLLTVALLLPDQPAHHILDLARALLPEGPALLACLPDGLREAWERQSEDDQRLGRPRRDPPGWGEILTADGTRLLEAVGLTWGPDGRLALRGEMASAAPLARLGDHRGCLADLIGRLKARDLVHSLPRSHLPAFAALCVALHRLDGQLLGREDLVSVLFAVAPEGGGLPVPGGPEDEEAERSFLRAVSHARQMLEWACAGSPDEALRDGLAAALCARLSDLGAFTLVAFLMLYGPGPSPEAAGRITLERFEGLSAAAFTDTFRLWRDVLGNALGTACANGPEGAGRLDVWADGLWAAGRRFGPMGQALAIHADDLLTTWEISWSPQPLREGGDPGAILARLCLSPAGEGGEGMLARLWRRTPRERLDALDLLARLSRGPRGGAAPALRAEDVVAQRLGDVAWILIDEVDPGEAAARQLQPARLEALVLGALCEAYGLAATPSLRALSGLVLSQDGRGSALLDLYAPALLLHWRLRLHGSGPLEAGGPAYEAFLATLIHLRAAGAARPAQIARALAALAGAQARLIAFFRARGCVRTAARHEARRTALEALRRVLAPAPLALTAANAKG